MSLNDILSWRMGETTPPPYLSITLERLEDFMRERESNAGGTAHRICFATTHKNALRDYGGKFQWAFSLPFPNTVRYIFERQTGLQLFPPRGSGLSIWHGIEPEKKKEYDLIKRWMEECGTLVFLRDLLSLSIALGENFAGTKSERTPIGKLEYRAKYEEDAGAVERLAGLAARRIKGLPFYQEADLVIPAPTTPGKDYNLPLQVAQIVSDQIEKPCCPALSFTKSGPSMKNTPFQERLRVLNEKNLIINSDSLKGKSVILLDDKYQSGATANYVAWKLQQKGVRLVYGLCLVKTRRDRDNFSAQESAGGDHAPS